MKIDIHTHFIPPYIVEDARAGRAVDGLRTEMRGDQEWMVHRQGYQYPLEGAFWRPEAKLAHMDSLGIDVSVLSIAPTMMFHWLSLEEAVAFCRRTNDAMADLATQTHGRLRGLATLPMQDPQAAVAELKRAVEEKGLLGALIGSSIEGTPLDSERFAPFLSGVDALNVPLLLHPYDKQVRQRTDLADFYMSNLIGIPLETTLAASRLILSGTFDRLANLTIVLMHAGGFMPYQVGRLDHGYRVRPETRARIANPPSSYLNRFVFDTITHHPQRLRSLVEWVGVDQVVLGTDIPFDMADVRFDTYYEAAGFDAATKAAVYGGNARRIFRLEES